MWEMANNKKISPEEYKKIIKELYPDMGIKTEAQLKQIYEQANKK